MRKFTRLLSALLVVCLLAALAPTVAFADGPEALTVPFGKAEGPYTLTVKNDGAVPMKYTVTVDGSSKDVIIPAGGSVSGCFDGGEYSVRQVGNPNYDLKSGSFTFECGAVTVGYEDTNSWNHTLGDDVQSDKYEELYCIENKTTGVLDEVKESDIVTVSSGTMGQLSTEMSWSYKVNKIKTLSYQAVFTGINGAADITGDKKISSSKAKDDATDEAKKLFRQAYPGYDVVESDKNSTYSLYVKVTKEKVYEVTECPADDVTLSFNSEVEAKTGKIETATMNLDRMNKANSLLNLDTLKSVMNRDNLAALMNLGKNGFAPEDLKRIVENDALMKVASVAVASEMPASVVTLQEIDEGDGYYEGLSYTLNAEEIPLFELLGMKLPVNIGYLYSESPRIGTYKMTVSAPVGEGFTFAADSEYTVEIKAYKWTLFGDNTAKPGTKYTNVYAPLTPYYGVGFNHVENGMCFRSVDLGGDGVPGATFTMVNRDQLLAATDFMLSLPQSTLEAVLEGISYEDLFNINLQLHDNADAVGAAEGSVQGLIRSFGSLFLEGLTTLKAPTILRATSDEDGMVYFGESNNVTVSVLLGFVPQAINTLTSIGLMPEEIKLGNFTISAEALGGYFTVLDNDIGYSLLKTIGIVGDKFPSGNYILFQEGAPEGYFRNLTPYTVSNTWNGMTYESYAKLGVIGPLVAEQLRSFVEEITSNNALAAKASQIAAGVKDNFSTGLKSLNEKLLAFAGYMDGTAEWMRSFMVEDPELKAALISYASAVVYKGMNLGGVYESQAQVSDLLTDMLNANGYTFTNLLTAINDLAVQAGKIVEGKVDQDWYFYNLSYNIFGDALDAFNYVLLKFVPKDVADDLREVYGDDIDKVEGAVDDAILDGIHKAEELKENIGEFNDTVRDKLEELFRPEDKGEPAPAEPQTAVVEAEQQAAAPEVQTENAAEEQTPAPQPTTSSTGILNTLRTGLNGLSKLIKLR